MLKKESPPDGDGLASAALRDVLTQTEPPSKDPDPTHFEGGFEDRTLTKTEVATALGRWARWCGLSI